MLGDFTDTGCSILSHLDVDVLQAVQDSREDLSLNDDLSEIDGVLSDLSKALADVALELSIWVGNESSEVWYCTLINDCLGQFFCMLSNFREGSS